MCLVQRCFSSLNCWCVIVCAVVVCQELMACSSSQPAISHLVTWGGRLAISHNGFIHSTNIMLQSLTYAMGCDIKYFFFIMLYYVFVYLCACWAPECHGVYMGVRRQPMEVSALLFCYVGPRDQTQVVSLMESCFYALSHLSGPWKYFLHCQK